MSQSSEPSQSPTAEAAAEANAEAWVEIVRRQVRQLRFGVVQIVVHDSRVVQIDRTERTRLDGPGASVKGGGGL
ncbi:MAG: YezD family protein [Planctomycetota bacterium]|nr:YezD family protein [Planctomycetota bacterium]